MSYRDRRRQATLTRQLKQSRDTFTKAARDARARPGGDPTVRRQLKELQGDVRGIRSRPTPPPPMAAPAPRRERDWGSIDETVYRAATAIGVVAVTFAGLVLAAGHLTARLLNGAWPSYSLEDAPGIVGRVVLHLDDPAAAWEPVNTGGEPAGPAAWWLVLVSLVVLMAVAVLYTVGRRRDRPFAAEAADDEATGDILAANQGDGSAGAFGGPADRSRWRIGRHERGATAPADVNGLVVGHDRRRPVTLDPLDSLLVVGPAHSGKSSAVAIPTLLSWPGPALAASTTGYLMDATIGWRRRLGQTHVYDPAGVTGQRQAGWSPLASAGTWEGAIRTAQQLTAAARASVVHATGVAGGGLEGGSLSGSAMAMSLAPFLYAAAASGRSVVETAEWIEREEVDEVLGILQGVDQHAAHVHETTFSRPDAARSAYFHTMYQVLSVYSDPAVAGTAGRHDISADELVVGGRDPTGRGRVSTVYLTAPEHDHVRFQPLFATIVRQIVTAVNERFAATAGQRLSPPLLVLLDEAMGAAALEALAELASTGATKGVQVVSIFEDLDRLQGLPGDVPDLLVRSHQARLVLAGAAGSATHMLPPGAMDELAEGQGALVYEADGPRRVTLRRWTEDEELCDRGNLSQGQSGAVVGQPNTTGESLNEVSPDYELVEEIGMFGRRKAVKTVSGMEGGYAADRDGTGSGGGVDVAGRRVPGVDDILGRSGAD